MQIEVFADGTVYSTHQLHNWKKPVRRQVFGTVNFGGYVSVSLGRAGGHEYLHRLVAKKFVPNPDNKPCVNHKNGNKLDNRTENLEWVTYSENHKHAYRELGRTTPLGRYLGGGVAYDSQRKKWQAYVRVDGKPKALGRFNTKQEARSKVDAFRATL